MKKLVAKHRSLMRNDVIDYYESDAEKPAVAKSVADSRLSQIYKHFLSLPGGDHADL